MSEQAKVKVKAVKRGTMTHESGTFHFDPEGHADARRATVPLAVAHEAKKRGLVKIVQTVDVDEDSPALVSSQVGEVGAERVARTADSAGGAAVVGAQGAVDTFQTTHTQTDRMGTATTAESIRSVRGTHAPEELIDEDEDGAPAGDDLDEEIDADADGDSDGDTTDADETSEELEEEVEEADQANRPILSEEEIEALGSSKERRVEKMRRTNWLKKQASLAGGDGQGG